MSAPLPKSAARAGSRSRVRRATVNVPTVTLAHGSGGKAMRDLIEDVFVSTFDNAALAPLEDQARFDLASLQVEGDRLAFTTDSYVVDPIFFPGGDIGKLAVCGTVNDLAVSGARPLYLSCGMIIEEGFPIAELRLVATSMRAAADAAGVAIVTGDTKVVHRGAADRLFINTAGVGMIPPGLRIAARRAVPGDLILVNGLLGDHGAAILCARGDLALEAPIESDCRPLNGLIDNVLAACSDVHCLRDATRGGVATVLNEFARSAGVGIEVEEGALPLREEVNGFCEILGLDPLYLANEGKIVAVVPEAQGETALAAMQAHPDGRRAAIIGKVVNAPESKVVMNTLLGGRRIVDMLVGDQLPRIC
jgi:hydrogenase expression/formation protein HypE